MEDGPQHSVLNVFERQEKKYLLEAGMAEKLLARCGSALEPDGRSSILIRSLYLDTPSHLLIRRSIEKPVFKEKLRVRSYGIIQDDNHPVFLEIKKKYRKTVYKRRVLMTLRDARRFVEDGVVPLSSLRGDNAKVALNRQIINEMYGALECYGALTPSFLVGYERRAYCYHATGVSLRLTLDSNLGWGKGSWDVEDMRGAHPLLPPAACLMELKTTAPLPLPLTHALDALHLYPRGFSKAAQAYRALKEREEQ
ncbi:MAG: polyphosphate polymerase domain-containing protein [Coriobacteriales bacterium]|jgi:hypothetical protein|nr:polyphosphate polymerase domain-containing protein [Coriobacteriales bacterium]